MNKIFDAKRVSAGTLEYIMTISLSYIHQWHHQTNDIHGCNLKSKSTLKEAHY